jgi:hypothetical protein
VREGILGTHSPHSSFQEEESAMASTALLRRLPSPALSSSQILHPLRRSRAMRVASNSHLPLQGASLSSCTGSPRAELSGERLHFGTEQDQDVKEVTGWKGLGFAVAMACPVVATTLLAPRMRRRLWRVERYCACQSFSTGPPQAPHAKWVLEGPSQAF